jgi:hypothetical protein
VLDQKVTAVESTPKVCGKPAGVVPADGRPWVAPAAAGNVSAFAPNSGETLQSIRLGSNLTVLAATPDVHYVVLASSKPGRRAVRDRPGQHHDHGAIRQRPFGTWRCQAACWLLRPVRKSAVHALWLAKEI